MRSSTGFGLLVIGGILFGATSVRAETAKQIVQKAVDARGGLDKLKKYPAAKTTAKGKMTVMNLEVDLEGEDAMQLPDQFKTVAKASFGGQKIMTEQIYNAGKTKIKAAGINTPVSDAMKEETKGTMDVLAAGEIYPLLDAKRFDLSVIDKPEKVDDKEVVGVLAKTKAGKEIKLFFDAKSFELLEIERKGLDFQEKEVTQQMHFAGHKKIDGILEPTKYQVYFDGQKVIDMELTEYKHLEKIDPKEFDVSD